MTRPDRPAAPGPQPGPGTAPAAGTAAARTARPAAPTRRGLSVRARVLAWVMVVSAFGMTFAGASAYVVQHERVEEAVDAQIRQETQEFAQLAQTRDPETGRPFASLEALFFTVLQGSVPNENEGVLTFIDGRLAYWSDSPDSPRLDRLPEFLDAVRAAPRTGPVELATVETAIGDVRYAAVPVTVAGTSEQGLYVVGYELDRELAEVTDTIRVFGVVELVSLVLIALVGWVVAGRLLRPVRLLHETARRIGDTDLTARIPVTGNDDLAELTRTVNGMLDRLETAFTAQRRLLDDVGHELRTPITVLQGHLELLDASDPGEVESTRALLIDELDRMNRLVEELLLLAKAQRPDFLRLQPVEVAPLVEDVLEKSRALGDRDWRLDGVADVSLHADPQRLTQALLQLVANAVRFTRPGDTVALGAAVAVTSVEAPEARIWVRDSGPGVAPDDQERIFRRFERGEGAPGDQGAGLGLPIVVAIAQAHGGRVDLVSAPGAGATFTVALPLRRPAVRRPDTGGEA